MDESKDPHGWVKIPLPKVKAKSIRLTPEEQCLMRIMKRYPLPSYVGEIETGDWSKFAEEHGSEP